LKEQIFVFSPLVKGENMPKPEIVKYSPKKVAPGSRIRISGSNLNQAIVHIGSQLAEIIEGDDYNLLVKVPVSLKIGQNPDISISNVSGRLTIQHALEIMKSLKPLAGGFTFSAPSNYLMVPSKIDQKYLVLMVISSDQPLPYGKTKESLYAEMVQKLSGPGQNANGLWQEASYGKTSFKFDIHNEVISLNDKWHDINQSGGMLMQGTGVTYPVTWSGGESLQLTRDNGFSVTVTFPSGSQTLADVINTIRSAIDNQAKSTNWSSGTIYVMEYLSQLQLESTDPGSDSGITVGGTAVSSLGLDNPVITPGSNPIDKSLDVMKEAIEKFLAQKSDEEVKSLLSQPGGYEGVILSYSGNDTHYWANANTVQYNIRNIPIDLSTVCIDWTYCWQVFAHEIGHNLGLPDLYYDLVGEEVGPWDIMDNSGFEGSHPTAWCKAYKSNKPGSLEPGWNDPWMNPSHIRVIDAPQPFKTVVADVLLLPTSCKMPAVNPFPAPYSHLPLVHAIRFKFDDNQNFYVEARAKGPFSHASLGSADYDSKIPADGVIVTDTVNDRDIIEVDRENVCLLTPKTNPLQKAGDEYVRPLKGQSKIRVKCTDVVGSSPPVYRIEASWGPGAFFDLRIDPWKPPPYESPDIWIDTLVDNEWDEYTHRDSTRNPSIPGNPVGNGDRSRVNYPCRVYARVWNDGDKVANNVVVDFSIVVPAGTGPGLSIGTATIAEIPAGEFRLAMVEWTPKNANEGHVCVQASINYQDGEANENNNWAQENVTDWFLEGGSPFDPFEFPFQIRNPLPHRAHIHLYVQGLLPGYHVDVNPVEFWLDPNEIIQSVAYIRADETVRFESLKEPAPLISLEWLVHRRCNWVAFGGISGWAHAVRKSSIAVKWGRLLTAVILREVLISASAKTSQGPIKQANVTVRIMNSVNETILITRGTTNTDGLVEIPVSLPPGYSLEDEYQAEILLSPTLGTGPAEAYLKLKFPG
jgi:hypothetical protein